MRRTLILTFLAAFAAGTLDAQTQPIRRTIANFPTCDANTDGVEVIALDPASASDCSTGSGTAAPHPCVCDGGATTWTAISGGGGVTDHGALTGLADDDHSQYALLAGRPGGQPLTGGTSSGENLTLNSTSHATKGMILFGASSAYDGANVRLGIGTATPAEEVDVLASTETTLRIKGTGADSTANFVIENDAQVWRWRVAGNDNFLLNDVTAGGGSTPITVNKGAATNAFRILNTETVLNDSGLNQDFRVESDNNTNALRIVGATDNIALFGAGSFGSGTGVVSLANATTVPSSNPSGGVVLYSAPVATNKANLFVKNEEGHVAQLSGTDVATSGDFVKDNTSSANVPGLIFHVEAGKTYAFEARLYFDANAVGGHKYDLGTSGTASNVIYHVRSVCDATNAWVITSRQTSFGSTVGQAGCTAGYTTITGTATFTAAGQVWVGFAQNSASGQSFVKRGSSFHRRIVAPG